ncbi:MAG: hypothetical protein WKG00_30940 [Polyangiaceae bacterium]
MEDLRSRREALVREHMATEERRDFDATVKTFRAPRYEIVPTGDVYDGAAPVKAMLEETSSTTRWWWQARSSATCAAAAAEPCLNPCAPPSHRPDRR